MKYFQVNRWEPDEEGFFNWHGLHYPIILRCAPPHGCYIYFPSLSSNSAFFRIIGFKSGQDCLHQLCPSLIESSGDWPYLNNMKSMLQFCQAIESYLAIMDIRLQISIF